MSPLAKDPFITLVTEIFRTHGRFRLLFQDATASTGLSRFQNVVLNTVTEARLPRTVAQLGRSLGHPRQVVQRTTNELIERGLLCMQDNPADKRARLVVPTQQGLDLKARTDEWARRTSTSLLAGLDPGLCEGISSDLRVLRSAIDRYIEEQRNDEA